MTVQYSCGRVPQDECKNMDNRLNFHVRFRPFRERFLRFKTTDGTRWTLLAKREHSDQIGIIMRLIFYKEYNEYRYYSLNLRISSAKNHFPEILQKEADAYYYKTEIIIDYRDLLSSVTYNIAILNEPDFIIYDLVKEKLRIEVEIRFMDVLPPPFLLEFDSKEQFRDQILSLLSTLLFYDIIVKEGTVSMKLHRCILSAGSKCFFNRLKKYRNDSKVLELKILNLEYLRSFFYYNYSGKIRPMDFSLTRIIAHFAKKFEAEELKVLCEDKLNRTVCRMLMFAHKNNISQMEAECKKYLLDNMGNLNISDPKWEAVWANWDVLFDQDTTSV